MERSNSSVQSNRKTLEASLHKMPPGAKYVLESSSVWRETYRFMTEDMGLDVILSNPYRTKIIAESKKKTDKVDARVLADIVRGGYIAECHVPGKHAMVEKDLVRYQTTLVWSRTLMKNKIHGLFKFEHMEKHPRRSRGSGSTPLSACASRTSIEWSHSSCCVA